MKKREYQIYDSKAEAFIDPFFAPTNGSAIRSFTQAANDPNSDFGKFPGDFTLFHCGERDDATGRTTYLEAFENLGTALQYVAAVAGE